MTTYRGKNSAKMFINASRSNSATKHGPLFRAMDIFIHLTHVVVKKKKTEKTETSFSLCGDVIARMLQGVEKNFHEVYFDNNFTSFYTYWGSLE